MSGQQVFYYGILDLLFLGNKHFLSPPRLCSRQIQDIPDGLDDLRGIALAREDF